MGKPVKDRGAKGSGSLVFSQKPEYPSRPNEITYYPPEPSPELKKRVAKEKYGGLAVYIIGFIVCLVGFSQALDSRYNIGVYQTLIPLALVLGLVFAILYIAIGNISLAKLARALPKILVVALVLLFIMNIITIFNDIQQIHEPDEPGQGASPADWQHYNDTLRPQFEDEINNAYDNLMDSIVNPAFFIMTIGLYIAGAGGNMLVSSTDIHKEYIPGMIIIETPGQSSPGVPEDCFPCQNCGANLTFIPQYEKYYCYSCKTYADDSGDTEPQEDADEQTTLDDPKFCGICGGELTYIADYDKHYCRTCKAYPKEADVLDSAVPEPTPEPTPEPEDEDEATNTICPTCQKEAKYIEQYSRWYCYNCKKYL